MNLAAGHQVRQWLYEEALDRALQVPRAIPEISSLHQQELPGGIGDINQERFACGSSLDTLLHHLKLNINDPAQFLITQRFEDYDLVQAVDELRRELSTSGLYTGARHSGAKFGVYLPTKERGSP